MQYWSCVASDQVDFVLKPSSLLVCNEGDENLYQIKQHISPAPPPPLIVELSLTFPFPPFQLHLHNLIDLGDSGVGDIALGVALLILLGVCAPKSFVLRLAAEERDEEFAPSYCSLRSHGILSAAQTALKGREIVTSVRDVEAKAGMVVYGWMIVRMAGMSC